MFKKRGMIISIGMLLAVLLTMFSATNYVQASTRPQGEHVHHFHGDEAAYRLLIRATANTVGQSIDAVTALLNSGKSVGQIVGANRDGLLSRYDLAVETFFTRQVRKGNLPQSVADARRSWYQRDARMMIDQPGLMPRFPGLHEVHVVAISAAVKVTGSSRQEIKAALEKCGTVSAIAAGKGKSAGNVVDAALALFDIHLNNAVARNMLTTAQRDLWRAALAQSLNSMMTTPGLHIAGNACAP